MIKPKFFKITVHSNSAIQQGTLSQGWWDSYFAVDFPEILDAHKYQLCVESFVINIGNTIAANNGYIVSLPGFIQGNTYDTVSQSLSPSVLVTSGANFNRFCDFSSLGYPLPDVSFMRGQNLRVTLSSLDGVLLQQATFGANTAFGTKWCMVLTIFPIPDE